jgi:anti-anti-sigma factor
MVDQGRLSPLCFLHDLCNVANDSPNFIKGLFPMAFQVKIAEEQDMVILALEGKMDTTSTDELSLGLEEVKRRGKKKIILLFKSLEQIDEQGVASLSSFLHWAERVDSQVKLAEVQPEVMKVLELKGLNPVYDSLVDAMKSYRRNEEVGMREEEGDDGFGGRLHSEGSKMPLLVIAGGIFVFFILIIIYMTRDSSSGIEELQKRVALLEERVTQAGGQSKNVSVMQEKIEGLRKEFAEKSKQLESDLAKLRQEMESASTKAGPTKGPPVAQPPRVLKYHTVMRGETLFGISRKYGITIDELRRLNNLKSNQTIGVGQKLIVSSS